MHRFFLGLFVAAVSFLLVESADAQVAYVTYYAPAPPVVYTTYYAPAPVIAYQPVPVARTRYRPFLGGTVTRIRPGYAPFVVNPMPVVYGY